MTCAGIHGGSGIGLSAVKSTGTEMSIRGPAGESDTGFSSAFESIFFGCAIVSSLIVLGVIASG
jgi:hypothetical protein